MRRPAPRPARRSPWTAAGGSLILAQIVGCAGGGPPPVVREEPVAALPAAPPATASPADPLELEKALEREREALAAERARARELERILDEKRAALAVAEERAVALEIELASAIEEVLRSKASVRSVQSRALATSRIAEVRVALRSMDGTGDAEATGRLERAADLLRRADDALREDNYSGAAYLAERASELVRQARTVIEVRGSIPGDAGPVMPLVRPRPVAPTQRANLREGPGLAFGRIAVLDPGEPLLAVARAGEWLQVEGRSELRGWVHSRLVGERETVDEPLPDR